MCAFRERAKDPDFLMTMVLTQCDHDHPIRSIEEDNFALVDPTDNRCSGQRSLWNPAYKRGRGKGRRRRRRKGRRR